MINTAVVSIIICTRNRAAALRETLASLAGVHVPENMPCELLVLDNGSSDDTPQVVEEACLPQITAVRHVCETVPGLSRARNRALAEARGQILLFTDDDMRLPADWITSMCGPIQRDETDAIAGGVRIATHLLQPWMSETHRARLAEMNLPGPSQPMGRLAGANMAFAKAVLNKVPGFDTELGAGALGFAEETLFSRQLLAAGYRIQAADGGTVEHHFDGSRLDYQFLLKTAQSHERSNAYVAWHWEHKNYKAVHLRIALRRARLAWMRLTQRQETGGEAPPFWEENNLEVIAFFQQFLAESRRPRNYDKHGLVKKTTPKP